MQGAASRQLRKRSDQGYDHRRAEPMRKILRFIITHFAFHVLAKVDRIEGVENIPAKGPAIIIYNHIAFVDPVIILGKLPRNVVPLAKQEVYEYPIWGIFPKLWQVIPVRRGEFDRTAIRKALQVLDAGEILLIAPEGTRNPSLRDAKVGVAYLATRTGAPIIPAAVCGSKGFPTKDLNRWRQPGAVIKLGKPFRFRTGGQRVGREGLRRMTDEAMYILAGLLPEELRGEYSDMDKATTDTIEYLE